MAHEVDLEAFRKGSKQLCFAVGSEQNLLLRSLFGERIEARTSFDLIMNKDTCWSIDAGPRAASAKIGRLYILDIPLEFGRLNLTRIRSEVVSASDQRAKSAAGERPDPLAPERSPDRFLFEPEVTHGRPVKVSVRYFPDGLYGAIEDITGFTTLNTQSPAAKDIVPIWKFDFASKRLDGGLTAVGVELGKAAITFREPTAEERRVRALAAIRHWG